MRAGNGNSAAECRSGALRCRHGWRHGVRRDRLAAREQPGLAAAARRQRAAGAQLPAPGLRRRQRPRIPAADWSAASMTSLRAQRASRGGQLPEAGQGLPGRLGPPERAGCASTTPRARRAALRRHPGGGEGAAVGAARCERDFVGTESRLNTIFDLLRQIVFGTEADPRARDRGTAAPARRQIETRSPASRRATCRCSTQRGPRPLPAVRRDRAGAAGRLPPGRGELPRARPAAAGADRAAGRAARESCWTTSSAAASRSTGPTRAGLPGVLRLPALQRPAGGTRRPARPRARAAGIAERDPRLRHVHYDWLDAGRAHPADGRGSSPSSCGGSSTTRSGWRTAG